MSRYGAKWRVVAQQTRKQTSLYPTHSPNHQVYRTFVIAVPRYTKSANCYYSDRFVTHRMELWLLICRCKDKYTIYICACFLYMLSLSIIFGPLDLHIKYMRLVYRAEHIILLPYDSHRYYICALCELRDLHWVNHPVVGEPRSDELTNATNYLFLDYPKHALWHHLISCRKWSISSPMRISLQQRWQFPVLVAIFTPMRSFETAERPPAFLSARQL